MIQDAETHQCETGCTRPARTTRMCWDCVQEITDALASVTAEHWAALELISRREQAPRTLAKASEGGHQPAGPCEPMNLTALAILQDLTRWGTMTAADWSTTDHARWWHHWVPTRCKMAVDMVEGEKESKPSPEYVKYQIEAEGAKAMPVGDVVAWLGERGVRLDKKQVGMWAARGKLKPRGLDDRGARTFHPADVVQTHYETLARIHA